MRHLLTALTVIFASAAAGVCVLWSLGSLSAWRRISYDPVLDSLYRYLIIVGATGLVYRFARLYAAAAPPAALDRPETWRAWAYLRWVALSVVVAWLFAAWPPVSADTVAEEVMKRTDNFLKGYAALLIVGLLGTFVGVKQAALKREPKQ